MLSTSPAQAKDMNGKFGVGFIQTLGGVSGLSMRYWVSRRVGIELDLGVSYTQRSVGGTTEILVAAGVFYALVQHRFANLLVGIRADVGLLANPMRTHNSVVAGTAVNSEQGSTTAEVDSAPAQFNFELPLIVEYFFSDSFSVNLAVGIVLVIVPDGGQILDTDGLGKVYEGDEIGLGIGAGGLLGSAGFTFYF